jgi:dihydroorotate dehydrogenase (NAD+) catalytic subunit
MTDLSVQLAPTHISGLPLANPVMVAAGTFGYGIEYAELIDIQKLGAIVCKGTTLNPRDGNAQPRLAETSFGVLNSIGLQNIGIEAVIKEKAPIWARWQVPVIVNIAGNTIQEYVKIASRLEGVKGVSGLEVNISCPNIAHGGIEFGTEPRAAAEVTKAIKDVTSLPVIVKLSPNVTDITRIAIAVSDAGADAITLINTLRGMAIDIANRKPVLGNIYGGLSGPAIKAAALYMVYEVASAVRIPIIGCGGITSAEDALEFIMAGATAVQIGTANLANPAAPLIVLDGIKEFLEREGIAKLSDIIGIARK